LSPATICWTGWVTGNRSTWIIGFEKVWAMALVMCDAWWAATMAMVPGSAAISGVVARSQTVWRRKPA
jgi:hypothetical protein